jgi:hypothetical protein
MVDRALSELFRSSDGTRTDPARFAGVPERLLTLKRRSASSPEAGRRRFVRDDGPKGCFRRGWAGSIGKSLVFASKRAEMPSKLPDFDQWIDAMAPVVKLEIAPEHRAGVKSHLKSASKLAALLEKAPLKDETDPAPVYRA